MRWIDKKNIFFLFLPLLFVACIDDEGTEVEAHADAYVIQKKIGDEVKVATAYYAFANTGLASVTVTPSPGIGDPFELEGDTLSITSFYKDPEDEDFTTMWPFESEYQFEVITKDGSIIQETDYLEKVELDLPAITSLVYFPINNALKVQWDQYANADAMVLKLFDYDRDLLFISQMVLPESEESYISEGTGNWFSLVNPGDRIILQVQSIAYESDATKENSTFNIATVSITERPIVWGN